MKYLSFSTLKHRRNFLSAAKSFKCVTPSLVAQMHKRENEAISTSIRVGFTATKTLGNAVIRNRVKRRLRAASAELIPLLGLEGYDYVFIGRRGAFMGSFDSLIRDMKHALKRLCHEVSKTKNQKSEPQ